MISSNYTSTFNYSTGKLQLGIANSHINVSDTTLSLIDESQILTLEGNIIVTGASTIDISIDQMISAESLVLGPGTMLTLQEESIDENNISSVIERYQILDIETLTGTFENITLPELDSNYEWDISSLYSTGELIIKNSAVSSGISIIGNVYVYPSPVQAGELFEVGFYINSDITVEINIFDMLGRQHVYLETEASSTEYNRIEILSNDFQIETISSGVYVLVVTYQGEALGKVFFGIQP